MYLHANQFDRYSDLDENGHDPATLDAGAPEHSSNQKAGWIDAAALYITDGDGKVTGFRKIDGSAASEAVLAADAHRYGNCFASDGRFCHVYNHSHACKPTCFKKTEYKKPSADDSSQKRQACRFHFWRIVLIAGQWLRRMGKALVPEPTVAAEDDTGNEFGRCKVCRENCFRGSTNDLCQVCLRCNVDYQYQHRTFPDTSDLPHTRPVALQSTLNVSPGQTPRTRLPGVLKWLANQAGKAAGTGEVLLSSFAVAMRSSSVADFYATKYLAKPQQWLATALGPLISGYRKVEEEQKQKEVPLSTKSLALRKMRTAIFAAFRSVWISSCEACLFIHTGGSAVQSHNDVVVHGHKGLFMMHECKRILNKQVAGYGLWHADLAKAQDHQDGEVAQVHGADSDTDDGSDAKVHGADSDTDDGSDATGAADRSDAEDDDAETSTRIAHDIEDAAETSGTTRHADGVAAEHTDTVEHADISAHSADQSEHVNIGVSKKESKAQIFQVTISLRDDWLHRGDALQDMDLQTYVEHIERRRKPIRGDDCDKVLRDLIFAFDTHYKLAPGYMQVLLPASRRKIARFNMAKCERENVNEVKRTRSSRQCTAPCCDVRVRDRAPIL